MAKEKDQEQVQKESVEEEKTEDTVSEEKAEASGETLEEDNKLQKDLDALQDKYMRLAAEYDNFRKRSQKEKDEIFDRAKISTLTALLPVYDNVERALKQPCQDEAYAEGVQMIMKQLEDTFQKLGVTEIESEGVPFDPNKHNAVMHVEDENLGENMIAEVFQKGFMVGDKVIRFAMVKVAN